MRNPTRFFSVLALALFGSPPTANPTARESAHARPTFLVSAPAEAQIAPALPALRSAAICFTVSEQGQIAYPFTVDASAFRATLARCVAPSGESRLLFALRPHRPPARSAANGTLDNFNHNKNAHRHGPADHEHDRFPAPVSIS